MRQLFAKNFRPGMILYKTHGFKFITDMKENKSYWINDWNGWWIRHTYEQKHEHFGELLSDLDLWTGIHCIQVTLSNLFGVWLLLSFDHNIETTPSSVELFLESQIKHISHLCWVVYNDIKTKCQTNLWSNHNVHVIGVTMLLKQNRNYSGVYKCHDQQIFED